MLATLGLVPKFLEHFYCSKSNSGISHIWYFTNLGLIRTEVASLLVTLAKEKSTQTCFICFTRVHSPLPFYLESEHKVQFPVSLLMTIQKIMAISQACNHLEPESGTLLCFLVNFLWNTQVGCRWTDRLARLDFPMLRLPVTSSTNKLP